MLTLAHFLTLGAILFSIGVAGIFLNRKNIIILLMSIELLLLAVNMNFVAFSRFLDNMDGQIFVFFILTVAAAEAAIGLAILVVLFGNGGTIIVADLDILKAWGDESHGNRLPDHRAGAADRRHHCRLLRRADRARRRPLGRDHRRRYLRGAVAGGA